MLSIFFNGQPLLFRRTCNYLTDIQPGLLRPCIQIDQGLNQPLHHIEISGYIIVWGQKRTSRHYLGSGLFVFLARNRPSTINTLTSYRLCCRTPITTIKHSSIFDHRPSHCDFYPGLLRPLSLPQSRILTTPASWSGDWAQPNPG